MDSCKNIFFNSAVIISFVTSFLYCTQTAYFGGYNGRLGLDADVLERGFQQILFGGFLKNIYLLCFLFLIYIVFLLIRLLFAKDFFISKIGCAHDGIKFLFNYLKKCKFFNLCRPCPGGNDCSKKLYNVSIGFCCCFLMLLYFAFCEKSGRDDASLIVARIRQGANFPYEFITVSINNKPMKLIRLYCGARNCAGIDPETMVAEYFPQNGFSHPVRGENTKIPANKTAPN